LQDFGPLVGLEPQKFLKEHEIVSSDVAHNEKVAPVEAIPLNDVHPIVALPLGERSEPVTRTSYKTQRKNRLETVVSPQGSPVVLYVPKLGEADPLLGMRVEAKKPEGILTKWWFWTAVGAGAALITGGSIYLAERNRQDHVIMTAMWR